MYLLEQLLHRCSRRQDNKTRHGSSDSIHFHSIALEITWISLHRDWLNKNGMFLVSNIKTLKFIHNDLKEYQTRITACREEWGKCNYIFVIDLEITKLTNFMVSIWRVCVCVLVAQSCPTLCDSIDCSPPGYSVHGILQVRILEWVPKPFPRGSSQHRDPIQVSQTLGRFFTVWATREAQSRSHKMQGWMTHKLESRFVGEISTTSNMQMILL